MCADNRQYASLCFAFCQGASHAAEGPCPAVAVGCHCTEDVSPVCAAGVEYCNACELACAKPEVDPAAVAPGRCGEAGSRAADCSEGLAWDADAELDGLLQRLEDGISAGTCNSAQMVRFRVSDGCGNQASADARVELTTDATPELDLGPSDLSLACDARCSDQSTAVREARVFYIHHIKLTLPSYRFKILPHTHGTFIMTVSHFGGVCILTSINKYELKINNVAS